MGFIPENVIVNLKKEIAASGGAAIEALTTRVQTLESTVGDETAGLVKDVSDLKTVVGDSSSGLVKTVTDISTYSSVETVIGKFGNDTLYRQVITFATDLAVSNNSWTDSGIPKATFGIIVDARGYLIGGNGTCFYGTFMADCNHEDDNLKLQTGRNGGVSTIRNLILEYTKAASPTPPETHEEDQEDNNLK